MDQDNHFNGYPPQPAGQLRSENARLRALLKEALPFIVWTATPKGLLERIEAALKETP